MDINKRTVFYMSILLVVTIVAFILAKGNFPIVSNIFLALFTSAFIVICTSLTNYWYEKEVFLNNLFSNGVYLNSSLEQIKQLIAYLDENSDLEKVVQNLNIHAEVIRNRATFNVFAQYSPFRRNSKESELVGVICSLCLKMLETIPQQIIYIAIAKNEVNILQLRLKQQEAMRPCFSCNIPLGLRPMSEECQYLQNHNNQIRSLQDKLLQKKEESKKLLNLLGLTTKEIQTNYVSTMNDLYGFFESNVRWMEAVKADKERTSRTMPDFVKNVMYKDNDSVV